MNIDLLKSKLHMARITGACLEYEGSLTIDQDLMDAVRIVSYEKLLVVNITNGQRFETYAIPGKAGAGEICLNGAAARLGCVGDSIIVMTFCSVPTDRANTHRPMILVLDEHNRPKGGLVEPA